MKQNRWKSPVLWAAVVSQILSILIMLKVIDVATSEIVNNVVAAVLQMGVLFGVLNNPTDKSNF